MSSGSYELSKQGDTWFAEGALESGRKVRFDCGKGSRDMAEGIAQMRWQRTLSAAAASKRRWERARSSSASSGTSPAPSGAPPSSPPPSTDPNRSAQIRGKLLSLGDSKPLDDVGDVDEDDDQADDSDADKPDYVPPGEDPTAEDDDDDDEEGEDDEEAAEFLAEMLGDGAVTVVTGGVTKFLKRRTPPMRPGDPHEKFIEFSREGFRHRARKLVGKNAKLGPNGKLFVGLAGMIGMMLWNAEPIDPEPAQRPAQPRAAAPSPPPPAHPQPAAAAPPAHANGTAPKTAPPSHLALVKPPAPTPDEQPDDDPLGSFS